MSQDSTGPKTHTPRGYERIDVAYQREVEAHGPAADEALRQAFAEGDIEAVYVSDGGDLGNVPVRMWMKPDFDKKVYPVFQTGRMRFWLDREKKTDKMWCTIFVPLGSSASIAVSCVPKSEATVAAPPEPSLKADTFRTGAPGRPTVSHLVKAEFGRRIDAGDIEPTLAEEAQVLRKWASANHPEAPPLSPGTAQNQIRDLYRAAKEALEAKGED